MNNFKKWRLKQLQQALGNAFPTWDSLARMVQFELGQNLALIAGGSATELDTVIFRLINWAESTGKISDLIMASLSANSGNLALRAFAEEIGWINNSLDPTESFSTESETICPYPGMLPFNSTEAGFFHGRSHEIQEMLLRLRTMSILFVIGPSGSGKSSLVFAGLLPSIVRNPSVLPGPWHIITIRPGPHPVTTLALSLESDLDDPVVGINSYLAAHTPAQRLMLIIDQFEECFTQVDQLEQARFIAILHTICSLSECKVIMTLRSDFYSDLMKSDLWGLAKNSRLDIVPLKGEALREAIIRPALATGVQVEPVLVERLVAHAANEPGALPLLQETLVLLWDQRVSNILPLRAYEALGSGEQNGLAVVLATRADAVFVKLTIAQQLIALRIFLRLVQFCEGRPDTRRQQSISSLRGIEDDLRLFDQTLQTLTDQRLLTVIGMEHGEEQAVDLAHEVLITGWPTLGYWISELRENEKFRRWLESRTKEWIHRQKQSGWLDDIDTLRAERWLEGSTSSVLGFTSEMRELIHGSRDFLNKAKSENEGIDSNAQDLVVSPSNSMSLSATVLKAISYLTSEDKRIIRFPVLIHKKISSSFYPDHLVCPYCLSKVIYSGHLKQCPECKNLIPIQYYNGYQDHPPLFVSLIGQPHSGKTLFLSALTLSFVKLGHIWPRYIYTPATEASQRKIVESRHYLTKGTLPNFAEIDKQDVFIMVLQKMERWNSRTLVIRDCSGEFFQTGVEQELFLLHAPIVFMLVDLTDLEGAVDISMKLFLNSYVHRLMENGIDLKKNPRGIVLILTKADLVPDIPLIVLVYRPNIRV